MKKRMLPCVMFATFAMAAAFFAGAPAASAADETAPIKIGLIVPLTGPNSFGGNDTKNAAEMAIKEKGSLLGRPVELVAADAPTEDEYATQAARLASVEGVKFFTTGYVYNEPSNQKAVETNGGFLMDCIGWNPELVAEPHPNYFLFTPTYIVFNKSVANYAVQFLARKIWARPRPTLRWASSATPLGGLPRQAHCRPAHRGWLDGTGGRGHDPPQLHVSQSAFCLVFGKR